MKKYLILIFLISCYSFSQDKEELSLEKAIEYGITNSHEIAIVKNDASIIKNNNHLGAAGMLPNISISSGYNTSLSGLNDFKFNPLYGNSFDMPDDQLDQKVKEETLTNSIGLTYRLFNGFNGSLDPFRK